MSDRAQVQVRIDGSWRDVGGGPYRTINTKIVDVTGHRIVWYCATRLGARFGAWRLNHGWPVPKCWRVSS